MKLPLSRALGGFMSSSSSYASVAVSALSPSSQTLHACQCDGRAAKMSTSQHTHGNCTTRSQRQVRCGNGISNFTQCLITCGLLLLLAAGNAIVEGALRNVNLIIEPPAVRRGQHAIVRCLYDLEGTPLYSAKFYRGQLEFYRYTPGEFPNTKVFPFPGIHVDVTNSNATQVLIRNVGFGLSGNFSCEVTADAPLFSTATATGIMQVVELPEKRPTLFTEHTRYEPGDVLRANCSTPPSRPRAELKFTINNMVVGTSDTQYIRTIDNLMASRISLKLQLQGIHFTSANPSLLHSGGGHGYGGYNGGMNSVHSFGSGGGVGSSAGSGGYSVGSLVLRCTAQIGDLYQEYKEIELGTPQKDPVPARVTLSSGSSMTNFFSSYFSSSSRRLPPPTVVVMLLMAIASVTATATITTTTLTATTMCVLSGIVELCIATFAFFNQMLQTAHKLSSKCIEQQQNQKQKQQQLQIEATRQQASAKLCHAMRIERQQQQQLLLPSQLQWWQNYAQQQQQQQGRCMQHATTTNSSALTANSRFTHR
uniref:Ig-like domain-containing protein n=1 Tax=Zeugodacus cucurbitae TaxID=28588 RepID=A0A0A1XLA2_ZEUCU